MSGSSIRTRSPEPNLFWQPARLVDWPPDPNLAAQAGRGGKGRFSPPDPGRPPSHGATDHVCQGPWQRGRGQLVEEQRGHNHVMLTSWPVVRPRDVVGDQPQLSEPGALTDQGAEILLRPRREGEALPRKGGCPEGQLSLTTED